MGSGGSPNRHSPVCGRGALVAIGLNHRYPDHRDPLFSRGRAIHLRPRLVPLAPDFAERNHISGPRFRYGEAGDRKNFSAISRRIIAMK